VKEKTSLTCRGGQEPVVELLEECKDQSGQEKEKVRDSYLVEKKAGENSVKKKRYFNKTKR